MKLTLALLAALVATGIAAAQQAPVSSPLLDHLGGHWVLRGEIAGKQTTHDVDADWVIQHHYLRLHEVSRDKDAKGQPQYEALVFVGMTDTPKAYTAVWLDVFGGSSIESIGVSLPGTDRLSFVFKNEKGEEGLRNDFVYDSTVDMWEWRIDNLDKGVAKPFARVKLTRK